MLGLQNLTSAALLLQGAVGFFQSPQAQQQQQQQQQQSLSRAHRLQQAAEELRSQLSKDARIVLPQDPAWPELQVRGSSPRISPSYSIIVQVATETDVQTTVAHAHRHDIPFLAVSGAHGWTKTLNSLHYGIQINMRGLNSTTVSADGRTAVVGGGTLQHEIIRELFGQNKRAVTGQCGCTSVIGPLLGGGHSFLQNRHGYSVDGLVSARIVLANGTLAEASGEKNPDLFWALKGAGHNFGIVTSFEVKTYDLPAGANWTVYSLVYTQDKLESVFSLINGFEKPTSPRPPELVLNAIVTRIPAADAQNPVIACSVLYDGPQREAEQYAAPFLDLSPVAATVLNVDSVELYTATGNGIDGPACRRNENILGAGISLPEWDLRGLRKGFSIFADATADPRFASAIFLLENYGMQGVRAIDPESAALAPEEREYPILASPVFWWKGEDEAAEKDASDYAAQIREALNAGVDASGIKRHTYVNYAIGNEEVSQVYGDEERRLEKLIGLKKEWDPQNRFGYYNPLPWTG